MCKVIPVGYILYLLRNEDLDLYIRNQAIKDKILNGINPQGFKILHKNYLLEISNISLSTQVASG